MISEIIKNRRKEQGMTILELSQTTGIDQALLSKYESGKRAPSEKHISKLSGALKIYSNYLKREYLADKIADIILYEDDFKDILYLAETRVDYLNSKKSLSNPEVDSSVLLRLREVDSLKEKWSLRQPMQATQLRKMQEYFLIKYTYESNQIEGNTLSLRETNLIINEGITVNGKSIREHLEAINHADAVGFIGDLVNGKEEINKRSLLDVHALVLKSIDQSNAGKWRKVPVRISGSEHIPPDALQLESLMADYFTHYERQKKSLHPVLMAAEMHERLVSIHPFIDGNGRTARLVMNFILLKNGYTVTSLKGDYQSRMQYYDALEQVQVNNDPSQFYHLIIDRLMESLEEHLKMI